MDQRYTAEREGFETASRDVDTTTGEEAKRLYTALEQSEQQLYIVVHVV